MKGTRRIVLMVSPELFGRIEARAAAENREDVKDWLLTTVVGALLPPRPVEERRVLDELRALRIAREIMDGGTPHAAHT